ncbi:MAG: cell division protein FtsL [Endozoicomonas sp. (ex Botrylloides leachii)]|nr:cell division protein FtsL [Endozoicomonas sp. (ex Botrylloides leachii)]
MLKMHFAPLRAVFNRRHLISAVLLLSVVLSGVAVSYVAYENRKLHNQLQRVLERQNQAQVEWGRLLLEESTLTAPARVERLARDKLGMEVPSPVSVKMVVQ